MDRQISQGEVAAVDGLDDMGVRFTQVLVRHEAQDCRPCYRSAEGEVSHVPQPDGGIHRAGKARDAGEVDLGGLDVQAWERFQQQLQPG